MSRAFPRLYNQIKTYAKGRIAPLFFAGASLTTSLAQLIAGFLIIKWVTPEEMGTWASIRLAQVYSFILGGINNGLSRELPFYLGKGDQTFSNRLLATAMFCTALASGFVLLAGGICAIVFAAAGMPVILGIVAITLVIASAFYQNVLLVTYRSKDSFNKLSNMNLIIAGLSFLTVPLVFYFHYEGLLLRTVLLALASVVMMYRFRPMRLEMRMDWAALKVLFRTGLPIFGLDYAKNSAGTLDRLVLLNVSGVRDVGLYSLSTMVSTTLQILPQSLSAYVYPRMSHSYGEHGSPKMLWKIGFKFVILAAGLTGLACLCGWLLLPWIIPALAPDYIDGIPAAKIILITGVCEAFGLIANALLSMKAWRFMVAYQLLSALFYILGPVVGVLIIGPSLAGVAWGVAIGAFCRSVTAMGFTYYATNKSISLNSTQPPASGS